MKSTLLWTLVIAWSIESTFAEEQNARRDAVPEAAVFTTPRIPDHVEGTLRSLNERLSRGVDPAQNAVVALLQIVGSDALDEGLRDDTLAMLGIESLSSTAPRFRYFTTFVESFRDIQKEDVFREVTLLEIQLNTASEKPWNRAFFPLLFDSLQENKDCLDSIVSASHLPRYYAPLLSEEEPPRLLGASFAVERRLPYLARCLAARAMLSAGENQLDAAILDLCAGHRLAKLLADGSPLDVSAAKAHITDAIVCRAAGALLGSGLLTGDQARLYLRELEKIGSLPESSLQADIGERAILHQEVELLRADESAIQEFFELPDQQAAASKEMPVPDIDWTIVLKRADEIQDQFVRALQTRNRTEQKKLFDQLDQDYAAWNASADAMTRRFADPDQQEINAVSRWVGETLAWSLKPWYRQRQQTDDRARVRRDMIVVGLGVAAYRGDHGELPESLSDLAPDYLKTVPTDAHSDQPFLYVRENPQLARITSWGANHVDDAGGSHNDDQILELR